MLMVMIALLVLLALPVFVEAAPAPEASSFYATKFSRQPSIASLTELGRALFFDPQLSVSGRQSCSSCHDPVFAYGPPNASAVQRGGRGGDDPGLRATPSLRYTQTVPPFTER